MVPGSNHLQMGCSIGGLKGTTIFVTAFFNAIMGADPLSVGKYFTQIMQ